MQLIALAPPALLTSDIWETKHGDMIARHDQLLDVLYEAASGASLAPVREERHLLPGSAARPGDLLIRRWADGKDAAIDVTVTVPLARFNVAAAADEAFNRKVQGTAQACQDQGIAFFPVAVKTLGGFHRVATEQVKRIGAALARHQGSDERVASRQLLQRLSITLMRGNAAMLMKS